MNYEFPVITHINDVLPAIKDSPEFIIAEKDGYTVINYVLSTPETFPPVKVAGGSAKQRAERSRYNAIRRECRGIIFCSETGEILRRPYHKFFNVGEKEETFPKNLDLSRKHVMLDKLDGSMIVPFMLNGEVRWGTKMGLTDVAIPVEEFIKHSKIPYEEYARELLELGYNPIFEWCSRKQRIVLDYGQEDQLLLTNVREIKTGKYMGSNYYNKGLFDIPTGEQFGSETDMNAFLNRVAGMKDVEGFVIHFEDGHMAKVKCDWYCQIHRAKDALTQDRHIVEMILDNNLDDVKAHLPQEDVARLEVFESELISAIGAVAAGLHIIVSDIQAKKIDRKNFALNMSDKYCALDKAAIFKLFEETDYGAVWDYVVKTIRSKLSKNSSYEDLADWIGKVKFNG